MQTFAAPAIAPARLRIHSGVDTAWAIALASAVLLAATVVGPDASWDLRNYHLYNGFAVLHGRIGVDLAPAQMQTFNAPLLDIVYTLLLGAFNDAPRLLAVMLAVPQALAVVLVLVLARRVLPRCEALAAVLVGATGVAALPTLATTMNEMAPAACILGAVLLLLGDDGVDDPSPRACLCAGFLGGVAVGLKLTSAPYALALIAMLPVRTTPERGGGCCCGSPAAA